MQALIFINEQPSYISLTDYPVFILICQVLGLELPRFCYHDSLVIAGNCRMCLIEDYKSPKPVIACALLVAPNDSFNLHTLKVKKAREGVLEFLLLNHPLDCPICDQGGECDLQDISFIFGSDRGRFHDYKRAVTLKNFNIFVKSIMTRCIHCTRCIRFATDFANTEHLGLIGRGSSMEISTYLQVFIASGFFSNVVDLCPVGALTSRAYSFIARPWELSFFYTFDILSIVISPIKVMFRDNTILRILPCSHIISNKSSLVSSDWIPDLIRHTYDAVKVQRLLYPSLIIHHHLRLLYKYTWKRSFVLIQHTYSSCIRYFVFNFFNVVMNYYLTGNSISLETIFLLKKFTGFFCGSLGYGGSICDTLFKKSYLSSLEDVVSDNDAILLLCGILPRLFFPQSNMFFKVSLNFSFIYFWGVYSVFNFGIFRLGFNLNTIFQFLRGKLWLCLLTLQHAMFTIIINIELLTLFSNALFYLNKILNFKFLVLGENLGVLNCLEFLTTTTTHNQNISCSLVPFVINVGFDSFTNLDFVTRNIVKLYLGHNADIGTIFSNIILPTKTFYETTTAFQRYDGSVSITTGGIFSSSKLYTESKILLKINTYLQSPFNLNLIQRLKEDFRFQIISNGLFSFFFSLTINNQQLTKGNYLSYVYEHAAFIKASLFWKNKNKNQNKKEFNVNI